jgi:hypothetical protein
VPTCSPANNTPGTCPPGQLCSPEANCVAGCTATTNLAQGSCPTGQVCALFFHFEIPLPPTTGQCQTGPVCTPACPPTQVCCAAGTAAAGQCRGDLQAC